MKKYVLSIASLCFIACLALVFTLKAQSLEEDTNDSQDNNDGPQITDTWDSELGFCHGMPTDCYSMLEVPSLAE